MKTDDWREGPQGWEFAHGREAPGDAARVANSCAGFAADDVDEWTADENVSCYNCRWRRWTQSSFVCLLPAEGAVGTSDN